MRAYLIDKDTDGKSSGRWAELAPEQLDPGELRLRVLYSSVNHQDALAATGGGKIVRRFPCVGGIDLVGEVLESSDAGFEQGQVVVATGFDLGVAHHGGFAEQARVPAAWALPLPQGMTALESMALGTAGVAAGLAILRMQDNGLRPANGPVVVSGATGGVGSLAVSMLSGLGYGVVALTRQAGAAEHLRSLGAARVLSLDAMALAKMQPPEAGQWAGAVDTVGGPVLLWMMATMRPAGTIASVGNAAGVQVHTTAFPLKQRGVSLLGVDSASVALPARGMVWNRLATDLRPACLQQVTRVVAFDDLPTVLDDFVAGRLKGRTVVRIGA